MAKIASQTRVFSVTISKLVKNTEGDQLSLLDSDIGIMDIEKLFAEEYPNYIIDVEEIVLEDDNG